MLGWRLVSSTDIASKYVLRGGYKMDVHTWYFVYSQDTTGRGPYTYMTSAYFLPNLDTPSPPPPRNLM